MVDVVFLIAAHGNPQHLRRLTDRLNVDGSATLIHIDLKADIDSFVNVVSAKNVVWLRNRIAIYWGGYSLMKAHLSLWREALGRYPTAKRIVMLSGADYPAVSVKEINERLLRSDQEFVRIGAKVLPEGRDPISWSARHWSLYDIGLLHSGLGRMIAPALNRLISRLPRKAFPGQDLYHGSAFYSLTAPTARAILIHLDNNPTYLNWFKWTRAPEELFVQTSIVQMGLRDQVSQDYAVGTSDSMIHGIHFIDWSDGGAHPRRLDIDDLQRVRSAKALFIRKVDSHSGKLLDELDKREGEAAESKTLRLPA